VTWLAPYLAGERHCLFNLQQQIMFSTPRSTRILGDWVTHHERLVQAIAMRHSRNGRAVALEQENGFRAKSRNGITLHGQCDVVVAESPSEPGVIADAKTGKPRGKDRAQVLTYMALAPWMKELGAITRPPAGEIVYADGAVERIPADEADEPFHKQISTLLELASGPEPEPSPSENECRFCKLADICVHREMASAGPSEVAWL
jgi:hypothetical protein